MCHRSVSMVTYSMVIIMVIFASCSSTMGSWTVDVTSTPRYYNTFSELNVTFKSQSPMTVNDSKTTLSVNPLGEKAAFSHTFQWTRLTIPDDDDDSYVKKGQDGIKVTYAINVDQITPADEVFIDHPLLIYPFKGKPIHLTDNTSSGGTGDGNDTYFYHLVPDHRHTSDEVYFACKDTEPDENGEYPSIYLSKSTNKLVIPQHIASCDFDVVYPPDVLYNLLSNGSDDVLITYSTSDGRQFDPVVIDPPTSILSILPNPRPVAWISSLHKQSLTEFEFAIALPANADNADGDTLSVTLHMLPFTADETPFRSIDGLDNKGQLDHHAVDLFLPTNRLSGQQSITWTCSTFTGTHVSSSTSSNTELKFEIPLDVIRDSPFGAATCSVSIAFHRPLPPQHVAYLSIFDMVSGSSSPLPIVVYDAMDRSIAPVDYPTSPFRNFVQYDVPIYYLHEASHVPDNTPTNINTNLVTPQYVDDKPSGNTKLHLYLDIHYQSPYPMDSTEGDVMYLHLIVLDTISIGEYIKFDDIKYSIQNDKERQSCGIEATGDFQNIASNNHPNELSIGIGEPIRYPSVAIPLKGIHFSSNKPIYLHIEAAAEVKLPSNTKMYAFLLPTVLSAQQRYTTSFASITSSPVPYTDPSHPLHQYTSRYTYRCLQTWGSMVGPFLFSDRTLPPTIVDTIPCPSPFKPDGTIDILTSSLWRKHSYWLPSAVEYPNDAPTPKAVCQYHLPITCGTQTGDGFTPLPLTMCPSFLGTPFSIPCHLVDGDKEFVPPINTDRCKSDMGLICLGLPELQEEEGESSQGVSLAWSPYTPPWVATTISAILEYSTHNGDPITSEMVIARSEPPVSFKIYKSPQFVVGPDRAGDVRISAQVAVNGFADIFTEPFNSPSTALCDGENMGPDPKTRLCRCKPGYKSNKVLTDNDLYEDGSDLECTNPCGDGFTWDEAAKRCNCDAQEYVDVMCQVKRPLTFESCHPELKSLPRGRPYYHTKKCDYGVVTDLDTCSTCQCFPGWVLSSGDDPADAKCTYCISKGNDDICVQANTDPITFTKEYCWSQQCICKRGYFGRKCEHRVVYGTLHYRTPITDDDRANTSLVKATVKTPHIISRRRIVEFEPRVVVNVLSSLHVPAIGFIQQATQVIVGDDVITSIVVALGHDPSTSLFLSSLSPLSSLAWVSLLPQSENTLGYEYLDDLYYGWEQLQDNVQSRPVKQDDQFGAISDTNPAYDPICELYQQQYPQYYCPPGADNLLPPQPDQFDEFPLESESSDNTTTYIIIGVVCGVFLLLFILLIIIIVYCRNHQKTCFKKKGKRSRSSKPSSKPQTEMTLATAADASSSSSSSSPASALPTSSYLPAPVTTIEEDPTLPPEWVVLKDQSTGKIYYSNKITLESSWDHPAKPKEVTKNEYGW